MLPRSWWAAELIRIVGKCIWQARRRRGGSWDGHGLLRILCVHSWAAAPDTNIRPLDSRLAGGMRLGMRVAPGAAPEATAVMGATVDCH